MKSQHRVVPSQCNCSAASVTSTHTGENPMTVPSGGGNVAVKAHRVQKVSSRGADCEGGLLKESPQL